MISPSPSSTAVGTPCASPEPSKHHLKHQDVFRNPRIQASNVIEYIAAHSSSTLYLYDLAEQAGFGSLSRSWSASGERTANVVALQTRSGSGLGLVGRLSQGTSRETVDGARLTAFTTPLGLSAMAQALSLLSPASPSSRLVLQVPTTTPIGETFSLSPSLAPFTTVLPILPDHITILLSATPQESVDFASLSYHLTFSHVLHIFDHHSSSREIGHPIAPPKHSRMRCLPILDLLLSAGHAPFEYFGQSDAKTVIVLLNGPLALAAKAIATRTSCFGVVIVKLLRPWLDSSFLHIIPASTNIVHVLDDVPNHTAQGNLFAEVLSTLNTTTIGPAVHSHRVLPDQTQEYLSNPYSLGQFIAGIIPSTTPDPRDHARLLFFSPAYSALSALPHIIQDAFLHNHAFSARLLTDYDVCTKSDKIAVDRMLLSWGSKDHVPFSVAFPLSSSSSSHPISDFLCVLDHTLLRTHSILKYAQPGSGVLVVTPWSSAEFACNIPSPQLSLILERGLRVYLIDAKNIASPLVPATSPAYEALFTLIVHLAFLRLYLGEKASQSVVHRLARSMFQDVVQGVPLSKINQHAWEGLVELEMTAEDIPVSNKTTSLKEYEFNAVVPDIDIDDTSPATASIGSWHNAARQILFPSIFSPPAPVSHDKYDRNPALRPEVPDRTYLVRCTVNRRLTPLDYDRNVFHLEFDTSGTGLTYAIGEALGVHGWNDEQEVLEFCVRYDVSPDLLITLPVPGQEGKLQTRTVFQALQQQIDIFGRPPKSFYTDLSAYCTSLSDKLALQFIGSPEGNATFKKMSEKDTVTFADVLELYPSARPGVEVLCQMIGDIKPRHYSIASAQAVVGDRVDLLVVSVSWRTPAGVLRHGQCTRYLDSLKVGQKVTVSIKPSVMKLPPNQMQPIIMAGLGTGAAPFRAFLQHRAWTAQQGIPVGPMFYYFGSRHQSQEFLYGEEIEAYILDGTITKAGLAFSRDGKKKVYIQHKMLEDAEVLADMLRDDHGTFYLCGPTWPVPDIYTALVGALVKYKGETVSSAGEYLESLKEEERYVLEVY